MSREIKFRVWDTKNEVWTFATLGDLVCGACKPDGDKPLSGAKQIWEQYTELKDKNGKEIYEGDIVEKCYKKAKKLYSSAPVEFKHGKFESGGWTLCKFAHKCEVIGNIHENPELVGGE